MPFGLSGIESPAYREWDFFISYYNKTGKYDSLRVLNIITIQYLYTAPGRAREFSITTKIARFGPTSADSFAMEAGRSCGQRHAGRRSVACWVASVRGASADNRQAPVPLLCGGDRA